MVAPGQPRIPGDKIDFRDEIMAQIFDRGDAAPKRSLTFAIEVTDEGQTTGRAAERRTFQNWRAIGSLTFDNAVISYNGDLVIQFLPYPTWRMDRNDPATATRRDGKKVR